MKRTFLAVWLFVSNENKLVHEVRSWFGNRSFVVGQEERLKKELNHIRKMRGIFTPPLIKNVWIVTLTHTNPAPVLNRDYQKRINCLFLHPWQVHSMGCRSCHLQLPSRLNCYKFCITLKNIQDILQKLSSYSGPVFHGKTVPELLNGAFSDFISCFRLGNHIRRVLKIIDTISGI